MTMATKKDICARYLNEYLQASKQRSGELLYPTVNEYIDILTRDKLWPHDARATEQLRAMSLGTMKRRVGAFMKAGGKRKGLSSTKPSALKSLIPIFTGPWTDKPPGYG